MYIAMLGWEFPPYFSGGLGVHCFYLTKALSKNNVDIDFYLPSKKGFTNPVKINEHLTLIPVSPSVNLSPYPVHDPIGWSQDFASKVLQYNDSLFALISNNIKRYDLIHAHDWLTALAGIKLRKMYDIPYVQTIHATEFDRTSHPWQFIKNIESKAVHSADTIITVSKRTKQILTDKYHANPDKITVIYNGINYNDFLNIKNKPGAIFPYNRKVVLFLGRITEQKGPLYFVDAANEVLKHDNNVHFIVAGTGDLLPSMIQKVIDLGILNHFTFTGFVTGEQRNLLYSIADVYVLPSTSEPFGITVLEALASGTPTIITKTAGVGEVVKSALQVDFWDVKKMALLITGILKHRTLHRFLAVMGEKEVRSLSWDRIARETISVYNNMCKKNHING
ncbi:glycosyltransferase family 4 protein [Candidatus Micrarchaeota archaeon]|nr:glycosyltransferase family 4 protein [Candidatus Micrarchaeota archaeon]